MIRHLLGFGLGACIACSAALAQDTRLFRGGDLSEDALIRALKRDSPAAVPDTPPSRAAEPGGEEPLKLRSIRVRPNTPGAASTPTPGSVGTAASRPSASILITFATDSADLTPEARRSLDVVGKALASDQLAAFSFMIEGHADPRGGGEYNRRLSQTRADAVRQYLVANHNISDNRLRTVGKGDTELLNTLNPIAPENRRVTIVNVSQ